MSINIDIPEAVIRNAIAVAVAESFSTEKRDALLRDIVRAHLQYKEQSYDKETILGKKIGNGVRQYAMEEVGRVLDEMRPDIEGIVREALGVQFQQSVYRSLRAGLQSVVVRNITVDVTLDRYEAD